MSDPRAQDEPLVAGPATQHTRWRIGGRTYGLVFLLVVALLVGLAVAAFQKRFTPVVMVSLETSRLGSQLQEHADVKLRGLVVGEVRTIEATPTGARLGLALDPEQVATIPANVTARLLPKTLFGERFVDLVPASRPSGSAPTAANTHHIAEGDVISQDRSSVAIELETVLDDLYPLLRTVQPAKLATTLNALATTLDGRGEAIGENVEVLDDYLSRINEKLPAIKQDVRLLGGTLDLYADLSPDLVRLVEALRVTNRTITSKDQQLAGFFVGTTGFAHTTAGFLRDNEKRIIQVGQVTRPTAELLAKYSPVYPCFTEALVNWLPRINGAFANDRLHITLEVVPARDAYRVGEEPQWINKRGPSCWDLPNPPGSQSKPFRAPTPRDGSAPPRELSPLDGLSGIPAGFQSAGSADSGTAGTREEQQVVGALIAPGDGSQPSGIRTLLAGPLLRGTVVSNR